VQTAAHRRSGHASGAPTRGRGAAVRGGPAGEGDRRRDGQDRSRGHSTSDEGFGLSQAIHRAGIMRAEARDFELGWAARERGDAMATPTKLSGLLDVAQGLRALASDAQPVPAERAWARLAEEL